MTDLITPNLETISNAFQGVPTAGLTGQLKRQSVEDILDNLVASATHPGIVELATSGETITGTDATRAVTPAGFAAAVAGHGAVVVASGAEVAAGANTTKVVTPAYLAAGFAANLAYPMYIGTLSSANDTAGITVSASVNAAFKVHADSGGVALTAGNIRAASARMLIGTAISDGGNTSISGFEGLVKSIVSVNVGGNQGGVMGHYETAGTLTLAGSINTTKSGVTSFLDLATGATVAAGAVVSAFGVNPANFGTVMTGRSSIIHVTNPIAGTWGSFLDLSTATGCTQDTAAGTTAGKHLKIYINGVLHTIPTVTA